MHGLLALATLLAGFLAAAFLIAGAGRRAIAGARDAAPAAPGRDVIAASLLQAVLVRGGIDSSDARARIADHVAAEPADDIDIASWAERYASMSGADERSRLLELAVQLAVEREGPIPLAQYDCLLDLSFGLGFQTDALARLRARYGFAYVDHAKPERPRSASRESRTNFYARTNERAVLLATLGLSEPTTRRDVISAYRKIASQCHPDHLAGASDDKKLEAVERFIDATAAYETLLRLEAD
ncbi:MAG: J domain-containing protein [Thermoanaerobaculia bacterium]